MFPPRRYATAAVSREIPFAVQLFLWQCIDALPFSPDYLQVFQLSTDGNRLKIVHTQEYPDYRKEYLLLSDIVPKAHFTHEVRFTCEAYFTFRASGTLSSKNAPLSW